MRANRSQIEKILSGGWEELGYRAPTLTPKDWRSVLRQAFLEHNLPVDTPPWDLATAEHFNVSFGSKGFCRAANTSGNSMRLYPRHDDRVLWLEGHHERVHGWDVRLVLGCDEPDIWIGTAVWTEDTRDRCPPWWQELIEKYGDLYGLR